MIQIILEIGLKKVKDPKRYGVANIKKNKNELKILKVVEKPEKPTFVHCTIRRPNISPPKVVPQSIF